MSGHMVTGHELGKVPGESRVHACDAIRDCARDLVCISSQTVGSLIDMVGKTVGLAVPAVT